MTVGEEKNRRKEQARPGFEVLRLSGLIQYPHWLLKQLIFLLLSRMRLFHLLRSMKDYLSDE